MSIGQLVVKIIGDNSQLIKDLGEAGRQSESFSKRGRDAVNTFGKAAVAAFAAAGAAAVTMAVRTGQQIKELDTLANVANTSVASFQRMAYASRTVGIEQDKLADILKDVNDRVGDFNATGGGPMADFFERIGPQVGVTAENFRNLSGPQALQLYVDSLQKANLSQADMTFYMEQMASDSTRLIPLLKDGGAAMAGLASEAEALGVGLSAVDVAKVQQANIQLGKISAVSEASAQALSVELMPIVGALADAFLEVTKEAGGLGPVINKAVDYAVKAVGVFANALRGIQVIIKGIQAGFMEMVATGLETFDTLNKKVNNASDGTRLWGSTILQSMADASAAAQNWAFGGTVSQVMTDASENVTLLAGTFRAGAEEIKTELHDLAMQPLPSEGIEKWVDDVRVKSQEAAEAVAEAQQGQTVAGPAAPVGLSPEETEALEKRVEAIRMANSTEAELMAEKYEADLEALKLARENKLITQEEYDAIELDAFINNLDAMTAAEQDAAKKRAAILEQERQAKLQVVQGMFSSLSSLMNTGSRKLFEIGKAASIANALVSGYEAVVSSYAAGSRIGGPPVGAAFAAAAGAATFAQIQQIKGASFGQKSAPVTFDNGIPTQATSQPGQGGAGTGGNGRNVSISLVGESFSRDQVRGLIDAFNTELNDGYKLTVSGGT